MQIINLSFSILMIKVKISPRKYERAIIVAGFFDIEATGSVLNVIIFPKNMWKEHH